MRVCGSLIIRAVRANWHARATTRMRIGLLWLQDTLSFLGAWHMLSEVRACVHAQLRVHACAFFLIIRSTLATWPLQDSS
jgi:hypothetical protein